ncbi:MAG: hypothetical protein IIT44_10820, partial [Erysipelotrichaceae bacterium]|nr:hypothetical protein [Erysipelotrichaceae bacterium]
AVRLAATAKRTEWYSALRVVMWQLLALVVLILTTAWHGFFFLKIPLQGPTEKTLYFNASEDLLFVKEGMPFQSLPNNRSL